MAAGCGSGVKVLLSNVSSCGTEKAQEISERIASLKVVLETARKACRSKDQEIHMVACPHCNNLVQSDAMFCSYCGKAIHTNQE